MSTVFDDYKLPDEDTMKKLVSEYAKQKRRTVISCSADTVSALGTNTSTAEPENPNAEAALWGSNKAEKQTRTRCCALLYETITFLQNKLIICQNPTDKRLFRKIIATKRACIKKLSEDLPQPKNTSSNAPSATEYRRAEGELLLLSCALSDSALSSEIFASTLASIIVA